MFNKTIRNKLKVCAGMLLCSVAVFTAPVTTLTSFASEIPSDVAPCADIIEWHYKIEDGKVYKALYNYSMGEYITEWQYVCDYPPEE